MAEHDIKMKVQFSESHPASESLQNIRSGESLPVICHRIHGWYNKFSKDVFATQFINMAKPVTINATRAIAANEIGIEIMTTVNFGSHYRNIREILIDSCDPYIDIKSISLAQDGTNANNIHITSVVNANKSFASGAALFSVKLCYLT